MWRAIVFLWLCLPVAPITAQITAQGEPSLTIYNGNFAVVRERLPLDLKAGVNTIWFSGATMQLEPESVMLRDPEGRRSLQILEQSYRGDPVTPSLLLSLYEGKTIDFITNYPDHVQTVQGKVIRSGYVPPGAGYNQNASQPIIEVDGKLMFSLPGQPVFPGLTGDTILKPTLNWQLQTDKAGAFTAELGYVTNGMTWKADYNLVAPEKSDSLDLIGWVTMTNRTGKVFENAKIRLMAGDVNKIQPRSGGGIGAGVYKAMVAQAPAVTEKSFDEFHLYTLERPTTLHDLETKQVEFVSAAGISAKRIYVYDGLQNIPRGYLVGDNASYGTESNPKVWVMQEFKNSKQNHLGIALPKGRLRFYRRDSDGSLQFVGENEIDHTPADETIRVQTGNAFDVVGERKRTDYSVKMNQNWANESFEIHLRNHKKEAVEVRVVEHLYRWSNWNVIAESDKHLKTDAQTIEYRITVPPDGDKAVTYTVHYTW
ncbi:MAG: hypothetical protein ABSD96_07005 [Candidatus Korobacteraceae bacterium]